MFFGMLGHVKTLIFLRELKTTKGKNFLGSEMKYELPKKRLAQNKVTSHLV